MAKNQHGGHFSRRLPKSIFYIFQKLTICYTNAILLFECDKLLPDHTMSMPNCDTICPKYDIDLHAFEGLYMLYMLYMCPNMVIFNTLGMEGVRVGATAPKAPPPSPYTPWLPRLGPRFCKHSPDSGRDLWTHTHTPCHTIQAHYIYRALLS